MMESRQSSGLGFRRREAAAKPFAHPCMLWAAGLVVIPLRFEIADPPAVDNVHRAERLGKAIARQAQLGHRVGRRNGHMQLASCISMRSAVRCNHEVA
jgi:hypothetical protein